jgi:glycosyltransferase involved in cell wall biosynthesis
LSRILLVCPEPLGHRQPAGVGIRFLEFARALRNDGHAVTVISRDGGEVAGCRSAALTPEAVARHSAECDVIVVQGHAVNEVVSHAERKPLVVDLYDPYIVENFHYASTRGREVYEHDHATFVRSLEGGDFFLCASHAQRLFYLGAMTAAGTVDADLFNADPSLQSVMAMVPFGVPPPAAAAAGRHRPAQPALAFGGIYDWYDPVLAIEAVRIARERIPALTLSFNEHPNSDLTPQGAARDARDHVRARGYDFVRFDPWVAYEDRAGYYAQFSAALVTFPQSLETELSMRTRIFDFLWGGLPVISSSADGSDEVLERYHAGAVVRSASADDFAQAIVALLDDEAHYQATVAGAHHFTLDHQWPRLMEPLLAFCRSPRYRKQDVEVSPLRPRRSLMERWKLRMGGRV